MTSTEAITELQRRLAEGLAKIDPHRRLLGRPVSYRVIDGQMLEITYRDVAGIADAEVLGVKRSSETSARAASVHRARSGSSCALSRPLQIAGCVMRTA